MEKSFITSELLAIRGGLSIISQYTDEIKKQNQLINLDRIKSRQSQERYEYALERKKKLENEYTEQGQERQRLLQKEKELITQSQVKKKPKGKSKVNFWFYEKREDESAITEILGTVMVHLFFLAITTGFSLLLLVILYPIRRKMELNAYLCEVNRNLQLIRKELQKNQEALDSIYHSICKSQLEIDQTYKEMNEQKTIESKTTEAQQNDINLIAQKSQALHHALKETYGGFLAESDWGSIDLIIHYIETGRADTLKEALMQVDRQRQTDQIVQAIQTAQSAICTHIESAFSRMAAALAASFSRLDTRLQTISMQLDNARRDRENANDTLMQKLDLQISTAKMNSSLLEKSNQSSEELMNELRFNQKYWIK